MTWRHNGTMRCRTILIRDHGFLLVASGSQRHGMGGNAEEPAQPTEIGEILESDRTRSLGVRSVRPAFLPPRLPGDHHSPGVYGPSASCQGAGRAMICGGCQFPPVRGPGVCGQAGARAGMPVDARLLSEACAAVSEDVRKAGQSMDRVLRHASHPHVSPYHLSKWTMSLSGFLVG